MRLSPGDIVEISLPKGFAYLQVTHNHPVYPEVVRVIGGPKRQRTGSLDNLAAQDSTLIAMVPVGAAFDDPKSALRRIGKAVVPAKYRDFPTFRMAIRDRDGNIAYWWFWDGDGLRYDVELSEEEKAWPMRETMSLEKLIETLSQIEDT